jgi:hypothetical protein
MTTKEKAKELVDKYWNIDTQNDYWSVSLFLAKKMASIAVDEILNAIEYLDDDSELFWENVKLEIWKL